jgi:hypothetical protein
MARLASGVVLGGVGLGAVISLAIDTEMNGPAVSAKLISDSPDTALPMPDDTWLNAEIGLPVASDSYRQNLDYDRVVGGSVTLDNTIEPASPISTDTAAEVAGAEAAREANPPPASQQVPKSNKSSFAQEGLY